MQARDYFPLGIATGVAFCNRQQETEILTKNIESGKHTLLMATRRYGKSSLALHAIKLANIPYVEIDFYMARNEKIIESYILNGVTDLIGKALGPIEKLVGSIKKYLKNIKPKLDFGTSTAKLELTVEAGTDPAMNVKEGLLLLERLLAEKQKRAVLLMDEFQIVGLISKGTGIEAAIRHVAQHTKFLTIIFSGSNRRLLKTMFEDETRPLYQLCWHLKLKKIDFEHYEKQLQIAAKVAWHHELDVQIIKEITFLTERHPYYMNKLCDRLWAYGSKKAPSIEDVGKVWGEIMAEEKSDAIKEISSLSIGQKTVLLQIASGVSSKLTGKKTMLQLQITSSSILAALDALEEKDFIEKDEEGLYKVINPAVKYYVLKGA